MEEISARPVAVRDSEDRQSLFLPCDPDKTLSLQTLLDSFPDANGLKFNDPTIGERLVRLDSTGNFFLCPEDGWKDRVYTATFPPRNINIKLMDDTIVVKEIEEKLSEHKIGQHTVKKLFGFSSDADVNLKYDVDGKRESCRLDRTGLCFLLPSGWPKLQFFVDCSNMQPERPINKAQKFFEAWKNRVFCIHGGGSSPMVGSAVLIDGRHILTAAHIFFEREKSYRIKGPGGEHDVLCKFISNAGDFAILHSESLDDLLLPTAELNRGSKYFMMGYPSGVDNSMPTITKGIIEGPMEGLTHLVGAPGSKRGYSGAPVFDDSGNLAGLLIGATNLVGGNTSINECLQSSMEQKYAKILKFTVIKHICDLGQSDEVSNVRL